MSKLDPSAVCCITPVDPATLIDNSPPLPINTPLLFLTLSWKFVVLGASALNKSFALITAVPLVGSFVTLTPAALSAVPTKVYALSRLLRLNPFLIPVPKPGIVDFKKNSLSLIIATVVFATSILSIVYSSLSCPTTVTGVAPVSKPSEKLGPTSIHWAPV